MFNKIPNGTVEIISNEDGFDFVCNVPPFGYGVNVITGSLEKTDVVKRHTDPKHQYFERTPLPENWNRKRLQEEKKQILDPDYLDPELLNFEQQEWRRRLCGMWFYNNGIPTYITGLHYIYVNWWKFQGRFMDYRDTDRKFFYVWRYCEEDPNSLGLIEFTKRRQGKTARSGCIIYEYISRTANAHGGIQSKTDGDAAIVFSKAIIQGWKKLPDFFKPKHWDTSQGDTPGSVLRFFKPSQRGKKAKEIIDDDSRDLESYIDYGTRKVEHYDGQPLHRYVSDESGKLKDIDIVERHNTVMFCSEEDGTYVGKQLYTTTVEEMEAGGAAFQKLVQMSNPNERDELGRTATGLYTYFLPSYKAMYRKEYEYNKYGFPDEKYARSYDAARRKALQNNPQALASYIRKNPNSVREAFWIDSDRCIYNSMKLNERLDFLTWNDKITTRGNFIWEGGVRDTKVKWEPNKNGKWQVCWMFTEAGQSNKIEKKGNIYLPKNNQSFACGLDGYDHDRTEDNRRSKAASFVLKRNNPMEGGPFNRAFVCMYLHRPATAAIMYEDILMQCVFFGCSVLYESQKPGIKRYFCDRGYEKFLVHLPDYEDYGIPSTMANKQTMAELTEAYIEEQIDQVFFKEAINDWLEFDIRNTEKYDAAMGAGYTLIADMAVINKKRETGKRPDISDFFRYSKN